MIHIAKLTVHKHKQIWDVLQELQGNTSEVQEKLQKKQGLWKGLYNKRDSIPSRQRSLSRTGYMRV
jgi:hypothetical protein